MVVLRLFVADSSVVFEQQIGTTAEVINEYTAVVYFTDKTVFFFLVFSK